MNIHQFILLIALVCNAPVYPAANAAASATPAKQEFDVKRSHAPAALPVAPHEEVVELDTSKPTAKLLTTAPSQAELEKSYAAAEQAPYAIYGLIALCQPYTHHNPDIFALTVFEKFVETCRKKNWHETKTVLSLNSDKIGFSSGFPDVLRIGLQTPNSHQIAAQMNPIFWCCLGIADTYIKPWGISPYLNELAKTAIERHKNPSTHYMRGFICRSYEDIERAHKKYWDAQTLLSQVMRTIDETVPMIPPEIAQIIARYYLRTEFGNSVEDVLDRGMITPEGAQRDICNANYLLISSLRGIRGDAQHCYELEGNIISQIIPSDLSSCAIASLSLADNRITTLPLGAFTHLENLNLNGNQLRHLTRAMFAGCNSLQTLQLSYNLIVDVEAGTFAQLPRLRMILMSGNRLQTVPSDFEAMVARPEAADALSQLDLEGNPFFQNSTEKEKYEKLTKAAQDNFNKWQEELMARVSISLNLPPAPTPQI